MPNKQNVGRNNRLEIFIWTIGVQRHFKLGMETILAKQGDGKQGKVVVYGQFLWARFVRGRGEAKPRRCDEPRFYVVNTAIGHNIQRSIKLLQEQSSQAAQKLVSRHSGTSSDTTVLKIEWLSTLLMVSICIHGEALLLAEDSWSSNGISTPIKPLTTVVYSTRYFVTVSCHRRSSVHTRGGCYFVAWLQHDSVLKWRLITSLCCQIFYSW